MSSFNSNSNPANAQNLSSFQFQPPKEDVIFDTHQMLLSVPQLRYYASSMMQQSQQGQPQSQTSQQQQQQPFLMNIPPAFTQTQPQQMLYAMPPLQTQQPSSSSATTNNVVPPHHYNQQQLQQQQQQQQQYQQMQPQPNNMQFFDNTIPNYLIMNQTISPSQTQTTAQPNISYYNYSTQPQLQLAQPISHSQPQPQPQATQPRSNRSRLQTSFSKPRGSRQVSGSGRSTGAKKQSAITLGSTGAGPARNADTGMTSVANSTSTTTMTTTNNNNKLSVSAPVNVIYANLPERLQQVLPAPPLSRAPVRPDVTVNLTSKRAKRKSKFTPEQDDMIVNLKKKGKSWVEIAEITGVGSYLAARNRFQVIVGQQGNNNSSAWDNTDKLFLNQLLDAGEIEKWRFICCELNKLTNKNFTDYECREMIRQLFWLNPASFGVNEETIIESQKEKKLTEKTIEQREQQRKKRASANHSPPDSDSITNTNNNQQEVKYIDPQYKNYQSQLMPNQNTGSGATKISSTTPPPPSQALSNNVNTMNKNIVSSALGGTSFSQEQHSLHSNQHHHNHQQHPLIHHHQYQQQSSLPPPPTIPSTIPTSSLSIQQQQQQQQQQLYNKQFY